MKDEKEIGEIIKQLRGDMSLRDFAKMCHTSHTTIDNIEKGIDFRTGKPTQVKMATLQKIASACGIPITYIVGDKSKILQKDELKVALFGGDTEVTDEMWDEVMNYADYVKKKYGNNKN